MAGSIWSDPRIVQLFAEPPERFIAARDAIAAELVRSAQRSAAQEVRALRRPPRRLWLLNRIARHHGDDVRALLEAGAELTRAHAAAVRGEPSALRAADLELSRRLDALVQAAGRTAVEVGSPADHALLVGLRNDLRTVATTDAEAAERLRAGTLDRLPGNRGEDLVTRLMATAEKTQRRASRSPAGAQRRRSTDAREERRRAKAEAKEEQRRSAAAKQELHRALRALAAAEREFTHRESIAARAEAAAAKARSSAEQATKAVERARARVRSLRHDASSQHDG